MSYFRDDLALESARRRMLDTIDELERQEMLGDEVYGAESPRVAAERYEKAKIETALEKARQDLERSSAAWAAEKTVLTARAASLAGELARTKEGAAETAARLEHSQKEFAVKSLEFEKSRRLLQAHVEGLQIQRDSWNAERARLADQAAQLRGKLDEFSAGFESRLSAAKLALETETRLHEDDRKTLEETRRLLANLQREANALKERLGEKTADSGPPPGVPDTLLDPAWEKVLARLETPLSNAHAHLRRLSKTALAKGPRAVLHLAAAELVGAQEHLRALRAYLEETGADPQPGRLEPTLDAVLSAWEPAFRARRIVTLRNIEGLLPIVVFDAAALSSALNQVCKNALEAMPYGGTFTLHAFKDEKGAANLFFADTGPGFPGGQADFTPFSTGIPGRLGLGLALTRRVMRSIGGEAEAGNGENGGGLILLRFPPAVTPKDGTAPLPPL